MLCPHSCCGTISFVQHEAPGLDGSPWTSERLLSCWIWSTPRHRYFSSTLTMIPMIFPWSSHDLPHLKKKTRQIYWSWNASTVLTAYIYIFWSFLIEQHGASWESLIIINNRPDLNVIIYVRKYVLLWFCCLRRGLDVRGVLWSRPFCETRGAKWRFHITSKCFQGKYATYMPRICHVCHSIPFNFIHWYCQSLKFNPFFCCFCLDFRDCRHCRTAEAALDVERLDLLKLETVEVICHLSTVQHLSSAILVKPSIFLNLPSGYVTVCHGKSPFLIG